MPVLKKINSSGPLICRKIDSGRVKSKYVAGSQKRKENKRKIKASSENTSQIAVFFKSTGKGEAAKTEKARGGLT